MFLSPVNGDLGLGQREYDGDDWGVVSTLAGSPSKTKHGYRGLGDLLPGGCWAHFRSVLVDGR